MDGIAKICRNNKTIRICNRDRYVIGIDTIRFSDIYRRVTVSGSMFYLFTNVRDKKKREKEKKKKGKKKKKKYVILRQRNFFYLSTIVEIDN